MYQLPIVPQPILIVLKFKTCPQRFIDTKYRDSTHHFIPRRYHKPRFERHQQTAISATQHTAHRLPKRRWHFLRMAHQLFKPGRSYLLICVVITQPQHIPHFLHRVAFAQLTPDLRLIMQVVRHIMPLRPVWKPPVDGVRIQKLAIPHHFDILCPFNHDPCIASANFRGMSVHLCAFAILLSLEFFYANCAAEDTRAIGWLFPVRK